MTIQQAFAGLLFWAALCVMCVLGFVLIATNRSRWALLVLVAIVGLATFGLIRSV